MLEHDCPVVDAPEFLLAALERANDAVVIIDGDLRVSRFNAAAELIWGLDRADVLGGDVSCLGLGDLQRHPVATPAAGANNGGEASPRRGSEIMITRKDGSRIRAALSLSPVEAGGQVSTIPHTRDITPQTHPPPRSALLSELAHPTTPAHLITEP